MTQMEQPKQTDNLSIASQERERQDLEIDTIDIWLTNELLKLKQEEDQAYQAYVEGRVGAHEYLQQMEDIQQQWYLVKHAAKQKTEVVLNNGRPLTPVQKIGRFIEQRRKV